MHMKRDSLFVVWKKYQRRAEILAPLLNSQIIFLPHLFRRQIFRPIDYVLKFSLNTWFLIINRPSFVIAQAPPLYSALSAKLLRVPYVIDAHNPVFQDIGGNITWSQLPLSKSIVKGASAVIVHNHKILEIAQKRYSGLNLLNIPDPIERIESDAVDRIPNQILAICSFDPDEPVDVLLESIEKSPEYIFYITADPLKLHQSLRNRFESLSNVKLTGFLPLEEYHALLCSSLAALVLTNEDSIQPSGACEALSSDTQLIISKTSLIQDMFGDWALLVDNSAADIASKIKGLQLKKLDLSNYRNEWNRKVSQTIEDCLDRLS